jgi:hypothetical protein
MRSVSDNSCRGNQNAHFVLNTLLFFENHTIYEITCKNMAVYEIMWKNMAEPDRSLTIWRMRIACWISKATNTLTIRNIYCFSLQQWLRERACVTLCIRCLSSLKNNKSLPEKHQINHTGVHELGARSPERLKFRVLEPSFSGPSKKLASCHPSCAQN